MRVPAIAALAGFIALLGGTTAGAQVYEYDDQAATKWHGARSVVLLPPTNESGVGETALAVKTAAILRQALAHSRKFEVVAIHPFNPAIQRAIADKHPLVDEAKLTAAMENPTLDTVSDLAEAIGVDFIAQVSVKEYKAQTDATPLEVTLEGALFDPETKDPIKLGAEGPVWGQSLSHPNRTDAKRLETEALSVACNHLVAVFAGQPLPAKPEPPQAKPAPAPAPETTTTAPQPQTADQPPAEGGEQAAATPKKKPLGRDVRLPVEWFYYLLSTLAVAGL